MNAPAVPAPRGYRIAGLSILIVAALAALVVALAVGGGAQAPLLVDPGPVVLWGLPAAKLISNLGAAAMLGSLVLALFALRSGSRPFDLSVDTASVGAAVFTVSSGLTAFLTFMAAFNPKLSSGQAFGEQFGSFLLEIPLGQAWLITTLMGAVVTVMAFAWRNWTGTLLTAILAAASLIPMATQGHNGDLSGHTLAVNAILLHTVGAAVWLGGLMLLVLLRQATAARTSAKKREKDAVDLRALVSRYSSLALAAFAVVAVSGIARGAVALGDWNALWSPYGLIMLVKAALLVGLGLFGVLASRDAVEDEMMKNSDFRELDISAGDVIAVVTVVLVVLIIWSLITVLLGVLTMRRSNVARILLVVSSAVVALLSLVGITSVFTAIWLLGGITVIVLLFIGDASRWFSRKPPSSSPGYLQY